MRHLAMVCLAQEAPGKETGGVLEFILDNPFALALTFVFLMAIIGAFVAARKRDRCLKKFGGFPITIREQSGRLIWGRLAVFSKGLELLFEEPYEKPAKNSFLVYEPELGRVLSFCRFVDRLQGCSAQRRERQAARMAAPPLHLRLWRWLRNIINTFRDAIVKAMGMSLQQAAKTSPSGVVGSQGGQLTTIGSTFVGETANAYEPMLERYIGDPVILEVVNPADAEKRVVEYHGYLGEYSPQFILLVGVRRRSHEQVPLGGGESRFLEDALSIRAKGRRLIVTNGSAVRVIVEGVHVGEVCHEMNETVEAGQAAEIPLPEGAETEGAAAAISYERQFDLIVPRACGTVRHASEPLEAPEA